MSAPKQHRVLRYLSLRTCRELVGRVDPTLLTPSSHSRDPQTAVNAVISMGLDRRAGALEIVCRLEPWPTKKIDQGFALDPRGKEVKDHLRSKRPPDTKAADVVPVAGGAPVAVGRAEDPRNVDPGTAANDAATTNT